MLSRTADKLVADIALGIITIPSRSNACTIIFAFLFQSEHDIDCFVKEVGTEVGGDDLRLRQQ